MLTVEQVSAIDDEIYLLQQCDHSNIVNYYESYEDFKYIYLCMELCTGGELIETLANQEERITEAQSAQIFVDLLSALLHIHA